MPNFDVSNLLTAQAIVNSKYAQPEMRMKPAPAFTLLSNNSNFLFQDAEALRTREDRAIQAYLLMRTKRATTATRTYNHTGTIDDSMAVDLAYTTMVDKFSISLKLLDKNVFGFNQVFADKLEQAAMNILEAKETEAIAYLLAQRATAQPALKGVTFNAANDAVEIGAADIEAKRFFARVRSVMRQNYFPGALDIIADSNTAVTAEFLAAQGAGNNTNWGYQFMGLNIAESVELTDENYADGAAIVFPSGTVGALNWIPKQNRQGWGDYNTYVGGYGTFSFLGFTFAVHGYVQRADTSATNGNTQDVIMEFELSLDSSYNKAPLSVIEGRTDSVIVEFGQTATAAS